jgi:peptidoglycan/xylan/chitin deacetylase (PgdA/CDA1 family)
MSPGFEQNKSSLIVYTIAKQELRCGGLRPSAGSLTMTEAKQELSPKEKFRMFRRIIAAILIATILVTPVGAARQSVQLPVLMYHFLTDNRGDLHICPSEFRRDLAFLRDNGYNTIGISELLDFVYGGIPLPSNPVMLTFDDGYYNNYHYGFPLLSEYESKAVIFLIANHTDIWSDNFYEDIEHGHLTWTQIREMQESGHVEFGGHTFNMHKMWPRKGATRMENESLCEFREIFGRDTRQTGERFADKLNTAPVAFAFPFHDVCDDAVGILKEHGYRAFFTYRGNKTVNTVTFGEPESLHNLYRINRSRFRSAEDILRSVDAD